MLCPPPEFGPSRSGCRRANRYSICEKRQIEAERQNRSLERAYIEAPNRLPFAYTPPLRPFEPETRASAAGTSHRVTTADSRSTCTSERAVKSRQESLLP
jgi:hypothetical protein